MDHTDRYRLDKRLLRASFDRAAGSYDQAAVLQHEVEQRMARRLDVVRHRPAAILDAGAGTGSASAALAGRYPDARVVALDIAPAMLARARARPVSADLVCADMEFLPLARGSVDMVFSNLALQWCSDLDRVFAEFRRVLRPGGLLTFTTFGPDTLQELRASWARLDGHVHVNLFHDMHDIGDALLRAGLAEPVLDVERYSLTYADLPALLHDLRAIGVRNTNAGRPPGLTGRRRLAALARAYEAYRSDGRLPASYEVIHAQAWVGSPVSDTESAGAGRGPIARMRQAMRVELRKHGVGAAPSAARGDDDGNGGEQP